MKKWRKALVYRSKDKEDWERAQELLRQAGVEFFSLAGEEPPVPGCGAKIDPRKFMNPNPVPTTLYTIDVAAGDREKAAALLAGKVLPVRSYGYGV